MPLIPITGGWRGFSSAKESAYGTPQTVDTSLNFYGDFLDALPDKIWDDKDEYTGELAPTRIQVLTSKTEGKHGQNLTPHAAALFLAWLLGTIDTDDVTDGLQAGIHLHKINMLKTDIEMVTRTVNEYDGSGKCRYDGVFCTDVTISGAREEFCKIEATLAGMGKETVLDAGTVRAALVAESYLSYADAKLNTGVTYAGAVPCTGGSALNARLQSFKLSIKNGAKPQYFFGSGTTYSGRAIRSRMLDIGLDLKLEFADRTEKAALLAGTTFSLEIPIIGSLIGTSTTHYYTCTIVLPKVAFSKVKRGVDDGLLVLDASYLVMADATYGPLDIWIQNLQAIYL